MLARCLVSAALLVALALPAAADDQTRRRHGRGEVDVFLGIPLDYSTDVIFPHGGSHHTVPGTVAVNRLPYFCAAHGHGFRARAAFVVHLRRAHGLADPDIPAAVIVHDGRVQYVGE